MADVPINFRDGGEAGTAGRWISGHLNGDSSICHWDFNNSSNNNNNNIFLSIDM